MFELLVAGEKAQLDRLKGDKKAYDLELRPRLMAQTIQELQDAGLSRTYGRSGWIGRKTASGLWPSPAEEAGTKSDASSSAEARTIRKSANGSRPPLRSRASLASPLAGPASGIR